MWKDTWTVAVCLTVALAVIPAESSRAGKWGIDISTGGWGVTYGSGHGYISVFSGPRYYGPPPSPYIYTPEPYYYPRYYNPIVRRDIRSGGSVAPDGTVHTGDVVEDRYRSYYSPGRNQAVTPPRTEIRESYGPAGTVRTQERTTWIGADGLPHSTTIDRTTRRDVWGNTHTDTRVILKQKKNAADERSRKPPSGKEKSPPPEGPQQK